MVSSYQQNQTSRIIIKNLPKKISSDKLRRIVSIKGEPTDIKLLYTNDDVFRRIAFVGFENSRIAQQTLDYLNGTFIDTSKIEVQFALPIGSQLLDRPWSKYSHNSSSYSHQNTSKKEDSHQQRSCCSLNENSLDKTRIYEFEKFKLAKKIKIELDELVDEQKNFSSELEPFKNNGILGKKPNSQKFQDNVIASCTKEDVLTTSRLLIRNLSFKTIESDLKTLFLPYGPLSEVNLPICQDSKLSKGYAVVSFLVPENALKALNELDGTIFQGRLIHLIPGKRVQNVSKDTPIKSTHESNQNPFFVNQDIAINALSSKLGIQKSELILSDVVENNQFFRQDSQYSLGARLAIAETHVINDIKSYLEEHGVSIEKLFSFKGSKNCLTKSDTVLLAKNVPFDIELLEIRNLFSTFGTIIRLLLPPSTKTFAIVEFSNSSEAKAAYKGLSYRKLKGNLPLFLDWAPDGLFTKSNFVEATPPIFQNDSSVENDLENNTSTIHVKNLSFQTTENELRNLFDSPDIIGENGCLRSVKIALKNDPIRGPLSLGYGFVEYNDNETANRAIDKLQGYNLNSHSLLLQKAVSIKPIKSKKAITSLSSSEALDNRCTKLIVRNVPFEATENEVRQLFKSFALVKAVRMPRRYDRRHRGFAFVDFATHAEAKNAFESLSETHFYGRHLVLEWAKPDMVE